MTKDQVREEFRKILYEAKEHTSNRFKGLEHGKYLVLSCNELDRLSRLLSKTYDIVPTDNPDEQEVDD